MLFADLRARCLRWRWPGCVGLAVACSLGAGFALVGVAVPAAVALWGIAALAAAAVALVLSRREAHAALQREAQRLGQAQQQVQTLQAALRAKGEALEDAEGRAQAAHTQWQDALKALQIQHRDLLDAHQEVQQLTEADAMNGLGSRRVLEERLNRIVHAMGERRAQAPRYAFLRIGVDDLQGINARWGRHVGDFVLGVVSTRLALAQREGDLLVRWGGDEYVSLIPADDAAAARACAERLRLAVAAHAVALPWGEVQALTVSIGFAAWPFAPERALAWQEAVTVAEWALQQAKANGRNRCVGAVRAEHAAGLPADEMPVTDARVLQWAAEGRLRALA